MVINGKSGYPRDNSSWILARIMRDFDHWMDHAIHKKTKDVLLERQAHLQKKDPKAKLPPIAGLIVSIYEPSTTIRAGTVKRDHVYWIGIPVTILQLGIAAIPCGIFGDWGNLMITVCGIALSIATGLLPQWKKEKWACRRDSFDSFILTRGNGTQHAIVILGNGKGLNLEDLATGQTNVLVDTSNLTRIVLLALATLWILLLLTAAGLKTNSWFLLAVGGVGIVQNIYVAGAERKPESFGIHLEYRNVIGNPRVMKTLLEVESQYPGVGYAMLKEFFPGDLNEEEQHKWNELRNRGKE
jgi:hypothetical protein